jgi:hypothetical protein
MIQTDISSNRCDYCKTYYQGEVKFYNISIKNEKGKLITNRMQICEDCYKKGVTIKVEGG